MATNLKYVETIELPSKVMASYSCEVSENGYISVATTSALCIYQICCIKDNGSPSFSLKKYNISPSQFVLSTKVGLDINKFLQQLPQSHFYEAVLSTELSSKLDDGTSVEPKIIKAMWSPKIINDYDSVLTTLTNTGSLELATKIYNATFEEFQTVYNVTQKYTEMCRDTWQSSSGMTPLEQYNELQYRINGTLPTAFTWSDIIDNNYCILIIGHCCGDISFWKVNTVEMRYLVESDINFMNVVNTNLRNISAMRWKTAGDNALLMVGNSDGKVTALKIVANQEQVVLNGELQLWTENDEITVKDFKFLTYLQNNYIFFVKGSDVIILLINKDATKIDSCIFHAGNIAITGLEIIGENKLLVTSLSGAVKELIVSCVKSKLNIQWRHFYVNINWYIYQLLNLVSSVNKQLFFFLTGPCKSADNKDDRDLNNLVIFINTAKDPLQILIENPSSTLRDHWDCLEAYRCQSIIDKELSLKAIRIEKHYDNFSLYQLRILLWISKLAEILYEQTGNIILSIKSYEDVYQIFNIKMAINRILYLLKLYEEKKNLTVFQLHNIFILNTYLKEIVNDDLIEKLELGENIVTLLLNIIFRANVVEYSSFPDCVHCGEKLIGSSCLPPHFDMRCSVSLMQVEKYPNYKCLICGSIAHNEIAKEFDVILCPFCDIPMCKRQ